MSMADDWKRLDELERSKMTLQYGQSLQVTPAAGNPDLVSVSKDLIRFVGDKTDVNAWRVYLGPWQVQPGIVVDPPIAATSYADPTPWAPPEPRIFDSFAFLPCYARVMFGSGGVQHTAFVDWPRRGLLLQVSGNYLQVNAFIDQGGPVSQSQLPLLQATMGPEPGGGDSLSPATFTYYGVSPQQDAVNGVLFQNFQIPPFARSFVPIVEWDAMEDAGAVFSIATQTRPGLIAGASINRSVWRTPDTAGIYDQIGFSHPFPISGQDVGTVRFEWPAPFPAVGLVGCMFHLDL